MGDEFAVNPSNRPGSEVWTWPDRWPWGTVSLFLTVTVAYALGSGLALLLIGASTLQAVFFIPAGITLAFLLRLPRRLWWVVLVGAGIAEIVMDLIAGLSIGESIGFAIANVTEPLVGATMVTAAVFPLDLARRRHLMWFGFGAVFVGPAVGAALGATADSVFGGDRFMTTFGHWWLGHALGVILVAGVILAWGSSRDRRPLLSTGGISLVAGSVGLTVAIFTFTDLPLIFSVLIGVAVAGAVFGVRAVTVTALSVALTIAALVATESGFLILGLTPGPAFVLVQLQVAIFTLAGLLIAAESQEREQATRHAAETELEMQRAARDERLHRDLALQIQRGLLPDFLVNDPNLEIAARYEAASDLLEVGGDWYDSLSLGDGRVGLVVGDIVGHGTQAMTSMGRVRTALAALAIRADHPGSLLNEVDRFAGGPDGTAYATVFYAIVDPTQHTIQYASAGHPPALLVRPSGETIWLDRGQSGPLHGGLDSPRRHASHDFEPGTTLILYTDGLIERRDESIDAGLARLERLIVELEGTSVDRLCDELFERLGVGYSRDDDVVLMVARATTPQPSDYRERFPAKPNELRRVRASVRSWAEKQDLGPALVQDLVIAVSEAAANSIRHAYRDTENGPIEIRISHRHEFIDVGVIDNGKWKGSLDEVGDPGLGRSIMRAVTDDLQIRTGADGTWVSFKLPTGDH